MATEDLPRHLRQLLALDEIDEVMLLSTCNRVEIWAVAPRPAHATGRLRNYLAARLTADPTVGPYAGDTPELAVDHALFRLSERAALEHIFRVTASLDAMVVGEAQVLGQVKTAYSVATRVGACGPLLNRCMHRAFAAAKRVRTETAVARHAVSVSSVAAELAGRVFGDLHRATVLVIGAGEMAELAVRHLQSAGAQVRVVNRTHRKAVALAFELGATAKRLRDLDGQLLDADIVICSTGSKKPILPRERLQRLMRQRKHRPLFIVDIAVPKDVEPQAGELPNLYLFNVDDLERVAEQNIKERGREVAKAERLLAVQIDHFQDWLRGQDAVPVIKALRQHFRSIARTEAQRTAQALHIQNDDQRQLLDNMADAIVNKLLHLPTVRLRQTVANPGALQLTDSARRLFGLKRERPGDISEDKTSTDEAISHEANCCGHARQRTGALAGASRCRDATSGPPRPVRETAGD